MHYGSLGYCGSPTHLSTFPLYPHYRFLTKICRRSTCHLKRETTPTSTSQPTSITMQVSRLTTAWPLCTFTRERGTMQQRYCSHSSARTPDTSGKCTSSLYGVFPWFARCQTLLGSPSVLCLCCICFWQLLRVRQ